MKYVKWNRKTGMVSCTVCGRILKYGVWSEDELLAAGHTIALRVVRHRKDQHTGMNSLGTIVKATADVIGSSIETS